MATKTPKAKAASPPPAVKKEKIVRITLEMSNQFLRLLQAKVSLSYLEDGAPKGELDPAGVLACLVLMEGRGGTELQVSMAVPPMWRNLIEAVSELREVREV